MTPDDWWIDPEPEQPSQRKRENLQDAAIAMHRAINDLATAEARWVDAVLEASVHREKSHVDTLWAQVLELAHGEIAPFATRDGMFHRAILPAAKNGVVLTLDDLEALEGYPP